MSHEIKIQKITGEAFSPFGDLMDCAGQADRQIHLGGGDWFADRAHMDFDAAGRAGVSLVKARLRSLPFSLSMMERHPLGSQAFIPMSADPFLVIVAPDEGGKPGMPVAFETDPGQAINYNRNVWHGVLTPLYGSGQFAVIERIGDDENLEEHWFDEPWRIVG